MKLFRLWLLLGLSVAICACGNGERPDTTGLKVYKVALDQSPTNLDPAQGATVYSNHLIVNAYDTLYSYKYLARPFELKPRLAESLPTVSDDGLVYTFKLKSGVRFIDDPCFADGKGREVVAQDVIYSLQRHFDPASLSQGSWVWQGRIAGLDDWQKAGSDYAQPVSGLTALDDHTLQITLVKPYPQLVHTLTMGFAGVVPREAVEKYGREFSVRPVGSGPFRVQSFDTTRAVLVRNPNYRQEPVDLAAEGYDPAIHQAYGLERIAGRSPPFVDRVEVNFIAEDTARMTSLTKGDELHAARVPSPTYDLYLSSKNPITLKPEIAAKYHMVNWTEPGFVFQTFNMDDPDFGYNDDPERNERNHALRCAIRKGFNWNERNERYYSGVGKIFPGIITPAMPEYDTELSRDSVIHDISGAKALLADAGWTPENLPELVYGIPASVLQNQYYEQFRGFMSKIGYPAEKIVVKQYATFGDISKAWKQSRLPLINKAWLLDYPDAENTLQLFYGPNRAPGSNDGNYSNPQYDAMFERAAVMQPGPERTSLYRRMNRLVINDCATITGLSRAVIIFWDKRVIAYPDRSFVGGFYFPYVDIDDT
ncbi:MAG: hypothetical protein HKN70_06505 [Gammaproteobacteria bacterium]|nr:hypothetical protein [Gammaproteobacteria bacterium]